MDDWDGPEEYTGCGRKASATTPVTWSHAFGMHLCPPCRVARTDAELGATERANAEARQAARKGAA
jgi:hypothetical protein